MSYEVIEKYRGLQGAVCVNTTTKKAFGLNGDVKKTYPATKKIPAYEVAIPKATQADLESLYELKSAMIRKVEPASKQTSGTPEGK